MIWSVAAAAEIAILALISVAVADARSRSASASRGTPRQSLPLLRRSIRYTAKAQQRYGGQLMRKTSALLAGVIAGLVAPATVLQAGRYPSLKGTDLSRIRGDVARVGSDFSKVIGRESGQNPSLAPTGQADRK